MKKEQTTDQLIASLDKEALREVLVIMMATFNFDITEDAVYNGCLRLEGLFQDKLQKVLEADEAIMRDANSLACDLNER